MPFIVTSDWYCVDRRVSALAEMNIFWAYSYAFQSLEALWRRILHLSLIDSNM